MDDLLTMSDIARRVGFSRQRVFVIASEDPDFPAPVLDAPRRRLWDRAEVEAWLIQREARTGKRRAKVRTP